MARHRSVQLLILCCAILCMLVLASNFKVLFLVTKEEERPLAVRAHGPYQRLDWKTESTMAKEMASVARFSVGFPQTDLHAYTPDSEQGPGTIEALWKERKRRSEHIANARALRPRRNMTSILFWTGMWEVHFPRMLCATGQSFDWWGVMEEPAIPSPFGPCIGHTNRSDIEDADAVVFVDGDMAGVERSPHHYWGSVMHEPPTILDPHGDMDIVRKMDFLIDYRLSSDIPFGWWPTGPRAGEILRGRQYWLPFDQRKATPVLWVARHCPSPAKREVFVLALMRHVRVHCGGACLNNTVLPELSTRASSNWRLTFLETVRRYKFYLAFENSICEDYVTEKFFMALAAGAIPITYGSPNLGSMVPKQGWYLDIHDYSSPQKLAEHLKFLAKNESAFNEFHKWRKVDKEKWPRELRRLLAIPSWECELCQRLRSFKVTDPPSPMEPCAAETASLPLWADSI